MTYGDIADMVAGAAEEIGCSWTYGQWEPGQDVPSPPYLLFRYPNRADFTADNENYLKAEQLHIELYTDRKDFSAEAAVERALRLAGLTFDKSEEFIYEEQLNEVLFETEVIIT